MHDSRLYAGRLLQSVKSRTEPPHEITVRELPIMSHWIEQMYQSGCTCALQKHLHALAHIHKSAHTK